MSGPIHFDFAFAKNGQLTVLTTVEHDKAFYLHSSIDPEREAQEWVKRIEMTENTLFVVVGCGLGYHIKALLKELSVNSSVFVITTAEEQELLRYINDARLLDWKSDVRVHFLPLANTYAMSVVLADFMLDKMVKTVSWCKHFPSMRIAVDEYSRVERELIPSVEQAMGINFNVTFAAGYHFLKNYWLNFCSLATHHGISVLKNVFKDIPVIVVAAGPSLDKNIHLLNECREHAIVIAAGTTIGALRSHGIQPDFFVVSDVRPDNYEVLKEHLATGAALVSSVSTNYKIIEQYPTSVYFFKSGYDYSAGSLSLFQDIVEVRQTVSVTTGAVDFAVKCGAKKVVLLGQDLAYASGKEYAEGTTGAGYAMLERVLIPGCNGQMVESNPTFKATVEYYNQYVLMYPDVQFINATEGGALIANMQQKTLRNVIDTVLPMKKVDKSFIHRNSNRKKIPYKAMEYLCQLKQELNILNYQVQEYIEAEGLLEGNDLDKYTDSKEQLARKLQTIRTFYTNITKKSGYRFIEMFMRPRLSFVLFKTRDGMSPENEYISYCTLIFDVQTILNEFLEWTEKNIKELHEKCGEKSKCKKKKC